MHSLERNAQRREPNPLTKPRSGIIYKYTPQRYAKAMVESGAVRIRPLCFYRQEEILGRIIGDKNEGVSISSMYFEHVSDPSLLSQNEQHFLKDHDVEIRYSIGTTISRAKRRSEELYVFCVSDILDQRLANEFCVGDESGIVKIPDLHEFFWTISEAVREYAEPIGYAKVVYVAGELDYRRYGSIHPALVKSDMFRSQSEVRLVWRPKGYLREHLDVSSPRIAAACQKESLYHGGDGSGGGS